MTKRTLMKVVLPAVGVTLGFAAVALADQSMANITVTTAPAQGPPASSSPSPEPSPVVTVNGRHVEAKNGAATTVPVPGGTATVERNGSQTKVTTTSGDQNTTSITGAGEVHVDVQSMKTDGYSFSSSNVSSSSWSSTGGASSSSTTVDSTGTNGVVVNQ